MENSINKIWKEGFSSQDLSYPTQINNLENMESIFLIDKFKEIYRRNIIALTLTALLVLVALILGGIPLIGLFLFLQFMILAILGQAELNNLNKMDVGAANYPFLKSFEHWLDRLFSKFSLAYKFFVPMLFVGFSLAILHINVWEAFIGETLFERLLNTQYGVTIKYIVFTGIGAVALLLSYFSGQLFKREFNSIYGDTVSNIKVLVRDLDELR